MPYIRISIVKPRRGQEARAEKLMRDLADSVRNLPGCRESYVLRADDGTGELARVAIYDDEKTGATVANNAHVMALRSELHLVIEPGHLERSFDTI